MKSVNKKLYQQIREYLRAMYFFLKLNLNQITKKIS
jgi:hypothetical protein